MCPSIYRALTNHIWPFSLNIWPKSDYFLMQYLTKIWPKSGLFHPLEVNILALFFMRSFTGNFNSKNLVPWFNLLSTGRKHLMLDQHQQNVHSCWKVPCAGWIKITLYDIRYQKENSEKANFSDKCLTKIWPKKGFWSFKWPFPTNRTIVSALHMVQYCPE